MRTRVGVKDPYFWSDLFTTKAFRRVRKLRTLDTIGQYPAVDDCEMFDFITDCSHMPADKPRVIQFARLDSGSVDALERRFNKNTASIVGQVCAVISVPEQDARYLTNMATGNEKKTLAGQLLRDA